ncbi:hypothetical protein [Streptomyces sp. HB-N217]|uniref:beta family protein n=1 Tax=Streptomyces sp. HB-N217 TaxID=2792016 RepID=UPI0035A89B69
MVADPHRKASLGEGGTGRTHRLFRNGRQTSRPHGHRTDPLRPGQTERPHRRSCRTAPDRRRQFSDGAPDFRKAGASAGETWLRDCVDGPVTDSEGTGTRSQWLWAGNVQHMTYVARCLSGS